MMNRLLFSMAFLFAFLNFSQAQTYVQIGTGTESSSMPYTSWSYSWSKALYKSNDLGAAKTITKIALESGSSKTLNNQTIYLKMTPDDALSGTYQDPENSGYTLVFTGNYSVTSGWNEITLDTPFEYDGTDNLALYWMNEHGTEAYASFKATSTTEDVIKVKGGDSSIPASDGFTAYPQALPNVRFYYQSDAPSNPSNPYPANNRIKVDIDTSLTFDLGENTTHYDLCFGTVEENMDTIVNGQAVSAPGTFTHTIDTLLKGDTKYFWQVIAINQSSGEEQASPAWNFETQGAIETYPWTNGFEDVWYGIGNDTLSSVINTNYPDSTYWKWTEMSWGLEKTVNYSHSGHYALKCYGSNDGEFFVQTPRFILPENMRVSFWWKNSPRTSKTANNDTTFFQVSNDGGVTWNTLDTLAPENAMMAYANSLVDLSAYSGENVYLRWVYKVTQTSGNYIFLDDVQVEEKPNGAVIELNETEHAYQELCVNGQIDYELVIRNTGVTELNISETNVTGDFECNYSGTIPPEEADTAVVSFIPTSTGSHTGTVVFNSNGSGENGISLSGYAVEPMGEFFETFDNSEDFPGGWNHIDSPNGYTSGGGVDIVSFSGDFYSEPNAAKILMSNDTVNPLLLIAPGVKNYDVNQLTFYAKKASVNYDLEMQVGVMSNPYDASTFIPKKTITLDSDFIKDTIQFKPTTTEPYIAFKHNGNPNGPDKWTSLRIDDISWEGSEPIAPKPAENVYPADDTSSVDIMKSLKLKWNSGSSNTVGYMVYFGENSDEWDIVEGDSISAESNSYLIHKELDYNTTYYWKVVPYNSVGQADNIEVWSFTTMEDPIVQDFPWAVNFDDLENTEGYTLPAGWSNQDLNDDNVSWDLWTDNPGAGANYSHSESNAMHIAFTYTPKDDYLYTPPLNLESNKEYKLKFWWITPLDQVTGQVYKERMKIFIGDNNIDSAMTTELFNDSIEDNVYKKDSIVFSPETDGRKHIGFYAWSDGMQYLLVMDDIELSVVNSAPQFISEPDTSVTTGTEYDYSVTATDAEGDDISITAESKPDWLNLDDNGDGSAILFGSTTAEGEYEVKLKADDGTNFSNQTFTIRVTSSNDDVTGIEEMSDNQVRIYPVPAHQNLTVEVGDYELFESSKIKVMDLSGKILMQKGLEGTQTILELSSLQSGIYILQIGTSGNKVTQKIIVK